MYAGLLLWGPAPLLQIILTNAKSITTAKQPDIEFLFTLMHVLGTLEPDEITSSKCSWYLIDCTGPERVVVQGSSMLLHVSQ